MASVYNRIAGALSSLGKRRERGDGADDGGRSDGGNSRTPKRFRPQDQSDLHRRLESFKPLTWFAKPDAVGPVSCALRGWRNDFADSLTCENCNAKLVYPPNVPYDQRQEAAVAFSSKLIDKHSATCLWRKTQCSPSLLSYIPTSGTDELCQLFQTLQGKLLKVDVLPDIDAIAIQAVRNLAAPYGSYEDLVLGSALCGTPRGRTSTVRITDVTGEPTDEVAAGGGGCTAAGLTTPGGCADGAGVLAAAAPTFLLQPSKLSPQQKARLLALLGWDVDVLQPESASGSAAAPYTQSAGYSLQHLGVKPKSASKPAAAAAAAATAPSPSTSAAAAAPVTPRGAGLSAERYPMASVVLKCPHCNCRTGLWNFAGLRPVPTGRLTPTQPNATGAAALVSSHAAGDPLSATIAGGQYGLHGTGSAAAAALARPFGGGASSAPFRFGSAASTRPVFGIAAIGAEAPKRSGGAAAGFGSPLTSAPCGGAAVVATNLIGTKRKAEGTPEPMAVDGVAAAAAGCQTPGGGAAVAVAEGKRPRLQSQAGASPFAGSRAQTPLGSSGGDPQQPRELDPLGQHRSWCPWVYTGTREEPSMSGWQHMLRALSANHQKQQQELEMATMEAAAATAASMDATPGAASIPGPTATPGSAVNARELKDRSLAAIRAL